MSDERAKRWIEESQKDTIRQSAGRQHLQAARQAEERGDIAGAEREYTLAAEAFVKSAQEYRAGKSYKKAALFMCEAGDVYSDMADATKAVESYKAAADDLMAASQEHLMWGEDAETGKGTALAMAACMIYIMIGKEADAFYMARTFNAQNASKIRLPAVVRLSQIPQMLENAIQTVNLDSFASAENAAVTELKAALASAGSQEFTKYVDRGLDMVRELLRGKLKVPKIASHLILPVDLTFSEEFPIRIVIKNEGEGEALNMRIEWSLDEGLEFVSGEHSKTVPILPPGESLDLAVVVKSKEDMVGTKEYAVIVRGTYLDKLKTEYSLQAGPAAVLLKDFKETEKLLHDADVTDGRFGLLKSSIQDSEFEVEPLVRIVDGLASAISTSRSDVEAGELEAAKARIKVVNEMIDAIDAVIGDDDVVERVMRERQEKAKDFALERLSLAFDEAIKAVEDQEKRLEAEAEAGLRDWSSEAEKKRALKESIENIKDTINRLRSEAAMAGQPTGQLEKIGIELETVLRNSLLEEGVKPSSPEKVELAQVMCRSIMAKLTQLLEAEREALR
ncbi:MAG: hypothetical protein ACP6KW_11010 [Candidatus Thorarchaeota archaeon]